MSEFKLTIDGKILATLKQNDLTELSDKDSSRSIFNVVRITGEPGRSPRYTITNAWGDEVLFECDIDLQMHQQVIVKMS